MASWQAWKKRIFAALFLGVVSTQAAFAVPVLSTSATPSPAVQGSSVAVKVMIAGIADLYGYQLTLSFNPSVLQATGVTEGAFLGTGGTTFFSGGTINNTTGSISFLFDTLIGVPTGVTGSGVLATVNFNAVSAGTSPLTFSDVLFLNSASTDIAVQLANGSLQVVAIPEPATVLMLGMGLAGLALRHRRLTT